MCFFCVFSEIPMTSITVYETSADSSIKENLQKFIENQVRLIQQDSVILQEVTTKLLRDVEML